jgi:hypothetical protein
MTPSGARTKGALRIAAIPGHYGSAGFEVGPAPPRPAGKGLKIKEFLTFCGAG